MRVMHVTPLEVARNFAGVSEVPGADHNPLILAMLQQDADWPSGDEVAWCKALVNFICRTLGIEYTESLLARSALEMGWEVGLGDAEAGPDLVVLKRGGPGQPGPEDLTAPGHVGFFVDYDGGDVLVWGGNQADAINLKAYPKSRILGIRRLI